MSEHLFTRIGHYGNWVDLVFIFFILYAVFTNKGFVASVLDFGGLFFSLVISLRFYSYFGTLLSSYISLSKGLSNALGFFIAWSITEIVFFTIVRVLMKKIPVKLYNNKLNKIIGFIPAFINGVIFFTFIITLFFTLPVRGSIKNAILHSKTAPSLIALSQGLESQLRLIFNDAIVETLNFLTIKQNSDKRVDLGFTVEKAKLKSDPISEVEMFNLINNERKKAGVQSLKFDESLRVVAREYGEEMFQRGVFSHYSSVDNASPAERLDRHAIVYVITGENLAYAPDVQVAHTGLINSEGHRRNILSQGFGKVGIGVIDAGIFGRVFVQEFTN